MKTWIPILILLLAVTGLCIWDGVHTVKVFDTATNESKQIYEMTLDTDISDPTLQEKIFKFNEYWTKEMDILCISISRKDLQPVSDYIQYVCSAVTNKNQEDAITYARLLNYNLEGLRETNCITGINLL